MFGSWHPDERTDRPHARDAQEKKREGMQLQLGGPAPILSAGHRMGACAATHLG
jgi:hypothetical protein